MSERVVIVGAGHAAGQAAASLRQKGYTGEIIMAGDEPYVPYQRPPLSKAYLAGKLKLERLYFKPENFYPEHDIDVRLSTRVESIDREARTVRLGDGEQLAYSKLILCTGSRVRELPIPGNDLNGVHYLRSISDVKDMQAAFKPGAKIVIVGGGYIGLEVAAVAVGRGLEVTVLETEERVMNRVVAREISQFFQDMHTEEGVKVELGRRVQAINGNKDGAVESVSCADGFTVSADLCVIGIGILPNKELAENAGLSCSNGIVVDEFCQTSDPDILAAGDCTLHPNSILGRNLRLESVHNAVEQGKTVAANICGEPVAYAQAPWFWSDQYNVKLQIVGLSDAYEQFVIRGNPSTRSFAAFYLREGKLIAVDAVNSPREFMLGKKLIAAGAAFDIEQLADESLDFKELANAALQAVQGVRGC
jgi:3-phenylpropionate/trans-cinnamate dioxygenase ferredoxin reductase subunit